MNKMSLFTGAEGISGENLWSFVQLNKFVLEIVFTLIPLVILETVTKR